LDNYLPDWIIDYAVLNNLSDHISQIASTGVMPSSAVANIIIQQTYVNSDKPFDINLAKRLASYRMERSKFYMEGNSAIMEEKIAQVFRRIDDVMRERFQKNILQMFCPTTITTERRSCYASAVYDGNASYTLKYLDFLNHKPLSDFIDVVIRYTENRLREQSGYTGRLRGIVLDDVWKSVIDNTLDIVQATKSVTAPTPKPRVGISLNAETLSRLRTESEHVRNQLIGEDNSENEPEKELLTDLRQILAIMRACNELQLGILKTLYLYDWECDTSKLAENVANANLLELVDQINDLASRKLGVAVISEEDGQYLIEDDFRDEFDYIYHTPELLNQLAEPKKLDNQHFAENPISGFLNNLDGFHLEIIHLALSSSATRQTLDDMAMLQGTMTELALDEINEAFQMEFNDILLETGTESPIIVEEYQEAVQKYFDEVA
jgi:hypothetical protein